MLGCRYLLYMVVWCIVLLLGVWVVFAQSDMQETMKRCLFLEEGRDVCYAELCEYEPGYLCAEDLLDVAVTAAGPERAMGMLHDIMASPVFAIQTDGHLLSHIIGRTTSRVFGSSGEHFLRCPSDFNNGCFHGFFEDTLPRADSPVDVVISICENMPADTPPKEKAYCYHGAGHVFMMQESHDLATATAHCLKMPDNWAESCWQGVFMENAGEREWEMKKKNFRDDEPLYPCTIVEDKFKPECYINHHGYLVRHYSTDWNALIDVCLGAGEHVESCLGGLGLMLSSSHWVNVVAEGFSITDQSHMEKTAFLCSRFPEMHVKTCINYAIPGFLNFNVPIKQISDLCGYFDQQYQVTCFERIGSYLSNLVSDESEKAVSCGLIPEQYRGACLGISSAETEKVTGGDVPENSFTPAGAPLFLRIRNFFADVVRYVVQVFFHPVSAQSADVDGVNQQLFAGAKECLTLGNREQRVTCYAALCEYESGYLCAEGILRSVTVYSGPEEGMYILEEMIADPVFSFTAANEGHSLAHIVGQTTASYLGGNGDTFLQCPTSLDYGCQHGFLEIALVENSSPAEAVTAICESLPTLPAIGRPNCYHGSGHGVMMNASYNFPDALAVCDQVPDSFSCLTGVTMENVSGHNTGRISELYPENNSFREDNPLAPCDTLTDAGHRKACYRQHMPYLASYFEYDLQGVVYACLSAEGRTDTENCVFGFGAYGIYDGIQESFLPGFEGDFMDKIIHMCDQFPEEYRMLCYTPAIDQSTVFYGVERAADFCDKIWRQYRQDCFYAIGDRLRSLVVGDSEVEEACASVPEEYRDECFDPYLQQKVRIDSDTAVVQQPESDEAGGGIVESFFRYLDGLFTVVVRHVMSMFSHSVSAQDNVSSAGAQRLLTGSKECLQLAEGRAECYAALCEYEPGYLCAEDILTVLVPITGAQDGIQVLQDMTWGGAFSFDPSVAHLLAHIVGRETARRYNLSGEAFLTCPVDFDYGCYHGFLEAGFLRGYKPNELVTEMCESMPITPMYAKVACYHGSGHALVMHYSYGLYEPLKQCDMLINSERQDACRSGVFMENVNGVNGLKTTDEPDNGFRDDNPLAPCSDLDEKYKVRCYENQMPYWLESLNYTLEDLIAVCDIVEEGYVDECVHSVGAYSIYPGNQYKLLGANAEGDFIDKTIYICNQFPEEHRMRCYAPAIQQNFIYHGIEVVSGFCEKIDAVYRDECWRVIGGDLAGKVENNDDLVATCLKAPDQYREICLDPYTQREGYADASDASFLQNNTKSTAKTQRHSFFLRLWQYAVSFFNTVVHSFRNVFSDLYGSTTNSVNGEEYFIAGIKKCLHSEEDQAVCYAELCEYEPGYLCAERIIDTVTA